MSRRPGLGLARGCAGGGPGVDHWSGGGDPTIVARAPVVEMEGR
ncbi:hypothetical protein [Sorangium sp. So ce854]